MIIVIEERPNPSSDFFVLPAVSSSGLPVVRWSGGELPSVESLAGATLVFVRYVPRVWLARIEAARSRIARLVFFMDDDVLDVRASAGMPLRYRFKLARLAAWRQGWLARQGAELWVSTTYLQEKYASWGAQLIPPVPLAPATEFRRVFYHGSASHGAELRWLRPVMEEALRRDQRLCFEVVGGRDVCRLYRGLPRVTVVHPMTWLAYQAFLAMPGRHVGLAPLLDLPFNRARSHTKFFDVTRCGAVGIYAADSACGELVEHGNDGWVCPMEEQAWVEAVLRLAGDDGLRERLLLGARNKEQRLCDAARGFC
jgi:hypothetical protein